jgi:catechol 2,3-dioxygenase-like lactoylglutathione lyase family enzyme
VTLHAGGRWRETHAKKNDVAITDLGIVSVPVSDQDVARAFYVDVLGLEVIDDSPMGPTMRWLRVAPKLAQTSITLVTWFPSMAPGSLKGLLFNTDDLNGDVDRFRAAGVDVSDVHEEAWGRYVTLDDPDGNGIIVRGTLRPN